MSIWTKTQFRNEAKLTLFTPEEQSLKNVQTALDRYHANPADKVRLNDLKISVNACISELNRVRPVTPVISSKLGALHKLIEQVNIKQVSAILTSNTGRNEIRQRNINVITNVNEVLTQRMDGTDYDLNVKFKLRQTDFGKVPGITISIPIKVHSGVNALSLWTSLGYSSPDFRLTVHGGAVPTVEGTAFSDAAKKNWVAAINQWWGKAEVHSGNNRYSLHFDFTFVDDANDACKEICCVKTSGLAAGVNPNGTVDAARWGAIDKGPGGPICHEVGHFLGNPDEYGRVTFGGKTVNWGVGYQNNHGVMNNPNERPEPRHYLKVGRALCTHFGLNPANSYIVLNPALSLDNPGQRKFKLSDSIWRGF